MTTSCIRKTHQLYDEGTGEWFDIYEAPGIEAQPITAEVPREHQNPKSVRPYLLRRGAEVAAVENDEVLSAAIASQAPVVRRAVRTGWRDDNTRFVSHRHVAGGSEESTVIPPYCPLIGAAGQLQICGTLAGWQDLVGVSRYSTAMTLALCAAFAAPLLALVRRPSFALVFFGPSKIGKSFAQLTAASTLGFGREQDLPNLNATSAGLLAAALSFSDHMLVINEVGTTKGPKQDVYVALRDTTYALMNGQDTIRHPSWCGAGGGAAATFQVIGLMSSEISPDAWAARHGETRDDGEMARLIGLPVLAAGHRTIFDRPPSKLSGDALAQWETAQFTRLTQELPNERGVAFGAYLDVLLADVPWAQARARNLVAHFEDQVAKPNTSPVARDIVAKFGVLFAGGLIAADAGIMPIKKDRVKRAVRRACLAALAELPDSEAELKADRAALKGKLASRSIIDLEACTKKELQLMRDSDGYRKPRSEGKGYEFVVRAQVFASWFGTPLRVRRLLEWLDDEGLLDHSRDRSTKRSTEWAQRQVTWPDGTRVRSVCLYAPHGTADFDVNA